MNNSQYELYKKNMNSQQCLYVIKETEHFYEKNILKTVLLILFFKKLSFVSEITMAIKISKQPINSETVTFSCQKRIAMMMLNIDSSEKISAAVEAGVYRCPTACSALVTDIQTTPK